MILVSTERRTFLLHHPGGKSVEGAFLAFLLLPFPSPISPQRRRDFFRLVSLGEELNMLNSAPSRGFPSDLPAFRRETLPVLWDWIAS